MSKEKTKVGLLEAGKQVFLQRGYNNSGIEAVLQVAGVPKGSFYYYFNSKEDFGLEVLNHFASRFDAILDESLSDESRSPMERLRGLFESLIERLQSQECRAGCLVGNLSQEMAAQSEVFRLRLEEIFEGWVGRFAACLQQAREAGEIPDHLEPQQLADFWLNSWQGAVLRAKTTRSVAPLRTFLDVVFASVLRV